MTDEFADYKKHLETRLEDTAKDWAEEVMCDCGLDKNVYNKDDIVKIIRFGYMTCLYDVLDYYL